MREREPRLSERHECRMSLFQTPLDTVKEIKQHRHKVFLAERRDVIELEDLKRIVVQTVRFGVQEPSERSGKRIGSQRIAQRLVLNRVDQIRERAAGTAGKQFERA